MIKVSRLFLLPFFGVMVGGFGLAQARASTSYSDGYTSGTGDWSAYSGNGTASSTLSNGGGYVTITNTDSGTSGAYSDFEGNRPVFGSATSSLDVYVDPGASINGSYTYQWDLSMSLNQSDSSTFLQDFIFHAAGDGGNADIWANNNSSDAPISGTPGPGANSYYAISTAGWYTFKWAYQDDGSGGLSTTMSLLNQGGSTPLWSTSFDNTSYDFTAGAQNRYQWFTYLTPGSLNIDNQTFTATSVPEPASLGLMAVGGLCLLRRRRRAVTSA